MPEQLRLTDVLERAHGRSDRQFDGLQPLKGGSSVAIRNVGVAVIVAEHTPWTATRTLANESREIEIAEACHELTLAFPPERGIASARSARKNRSCRSAQQLRFREVDAGVRSTTLARDECLAIRARANLPTRARANRRTLALRTGSARPRWRAVRKVRPDRAARGGEPHAHRIHRAQRPGHGVSVRP